MRRSGSICIGLLWALLVRGAMAGCVVWTSAGEPAGGFPDPLGKLLTSQAPCPVEVFSLRALLREQGFTSEATLVANRGFHNPAAGSFSIFEIVSAPARGVEAGDFFFGHFTAPDDAGFLVADQDPRNGALMIEAFAWDPVRKGFNFYELRGNGREGQWYYRGNSEDIAADNSLLHRQPDPANPVFGQRLRCSACHSAGGPIMKELAAPWNDWWKPWRKTGFGGRVPDAALQEILDTLVAPEYLARSVLRGVHKLETHRSQARRSWQERLRPLFCPVELNLMSDRVPNDLHQPEVLIPADFFVDSRLLSSGQPPFVRISRTHYTAALRQTGTRFPETAAQDADTAWLTPVKAQSDRIAVDRLLKTGDIDEKFMLDVLAVDMTDPVFSETRCRLLRFVPEEKNAAWRQQFVDNLTRSGDEAAAVLAANLQDARKNPDYYRKMASQFLVRCQVRMTDGKQVQVIYQWLLQRREAVVRSEISTNPRGQILEPGFRLIFPEHAWQIPERSLKLDQECGITD